jgi:DNA-nicking Smr family endonuclease
MDCKLTPTEQFLLDYVQRHPMTDKDALLAAPNAPASHASSFNNTNNSSSSSSSSNTRAGKKNKKRRSAYTETECDVQTDLHGLTVEEALYRIEEYMHMMQKAGLSTLRIVHGGGHSGFGPIKKALYRNFKGKWRHFMVAFGLEQGNAGSTLVHIKQANKK